MKHPFDAPTGKSLLEAKDYWEDALEFAKGQDNKEEIDIAEENLKDINADLVEVEAELGEIETS